jgi:hypothetical protein
LERLGVLRDGPVVVMIDEPDGAPDASRPRRITGVKLMRRLVAQP